MNDKLAERLIQAVEKLTLALESARLNPSNGTSKATAPSVPRTQKGPNESALIDYLQALGDTVQRIGLSTSKREEFGLLGTREEQCAKLLALMQDGIVVKNAWGYVFSDSEKGRHGSIRGAQAQAQPREPLPKLEPIDIDFTV